MNEDARKQARENLYDLQAEEALISHACNNPRLLIEHPDIIDILTAERQGLAKIILTLASDDETLTTEAVRLSKGSETEQDLFSKLSTLTPQATAKKVMEALRDVTARREVASGAAAAFATASEGTEPALSPIEALESHVSRARQILQGHLTSGGISHVGDVTELIEDIAWRAQNPGKVKGMELKFPKLNKLIDGLQPSKLYLIGARPSVGKTALAGDIAVDLVRNGIGVAFFSCEMSKLQLQQRLLATRVGVNPTKSLHGALIKSELDDIRAGVREMKTWPLWIDDTDRINVELLRSRARRAVTKDGVKVIIVDYIQLVRGVEGKSRLSKKDEVGEVSGALKALSKELGVPVIALAQLRRTGNAYSSSSSQTEIPRPTLESLKESGDLEQDADVVILLHRDAAQSASNAVAIVAKNRSGGNGEVDLDFANDTTSFSESLAQSVRP